MAMNDTPFGDLAERLAAAGMKPEVPAGSIMSLHPETVANAGEHVANFKEFRKPRRKRRGKKPEATVAAVPIKVDPRVMETAVELAGRDMRRLQINKDGSVTVLNHPRTTKPQENK